MQTMRVFIILLTFVFVSGLRLPQNNSAVLISKYAKVAKWGTTSHNTSKETGRSYAANWKERSSSNSDSIGNQIVYQYPVYKKSTENADAETELVPGIGEVIQDRFQVRPYFGYHSQLKDSPTYLPPVSSAVVLPTPSSQVSSPPAIQAPTPLISPPTFPASDFKTSSPSSEKPSNLYDSPYTSYNPPPITNQDMSDTDQNYFPPNKPQTNQDTSSFSSAEDSFPPNKPQTNQDTSSFSSAEDSYANAPVSSSGSYNYRQMPKHPIMITNEENMIGDNFHQEVESPTDNYGAQHGNHGSHQALNSYEGANNEDSSAPKHPPKSIDDVYYPPDFPKDQMPGGPGNEGKGHHIDFSSNYDFPKYLYDDHHIFEEVPHKTTTPAPENKRVSTTQYSYYYLGRKLWYIPLYFSIYFMIYVTALIIKSIARHKVTFRNEWISGHTRSARDLTFDHIEAIEEVHKNITTAIDKADKLYSQFVM